MRGLEICVLNGLIADIQADRLVWGKLGRATADDLRAWSIRNRVDLALGGLILFVIACGVAYLASSVPPVLSDARHDAWVWFEADLIRVQEVMISRGADNYRTNVHPLQPLFMYPPTKALMMLGLSERIATIACLSGIAGLWASVLFAALRGMGLRRPDSLVFTAFGCATSSAIFWLPVPEVYGLAAITVTATFAFATLIQNNRLPRAVLPFVSAFSMAMTTTNWMAGILVSLTTQHYARAIRITCDALLIVTVLFIIQKLIFPFSQFFIPDVAHELKFIGHDLAGEPSNRLAAFFVYGIAIPQVPFLDNPQFPDWMRLSVQLSPLSDLSVTALLGLALWAPVLVLGLGYGLWAQKNRPLALALAGYLCFELVLHLFYGDELFIYSLNYVPAMILIAGFAAQSVLRPYVLGAMVVATVAVGSNNLAEFTRVTDDIAAHAAIVLAERAPDVTN